MARLPTSYNEINDLVALDSADLNTIELKAKTLTLEECLDYLLVDRNELDAETMEKAKRIWKRGRLSAVHTAGERLFSQMQQKGGAQAALDYLKQMSPTFQAEVKSSGSGFKFNVVIDE